MAAAEIKRMNLKEVKRNANEVKSRRIAI